MATTNDEPTNPAKMAVLDHYEWMLGVQIDVIDHIDSKATSHVTFVGTVLVAVVAGVGLLARPELGTAGTVQGTPAVALLAFVIAVSWLLLSIGYGVVTMTVGWFAYGLHPAIGELLVEGRLERAEYIEVLLRGYSDAITVNEHVIERAGARFRQSQSAMLTGLLALVAAWVLYRFGSDRPIEYVALVAGTVLAWLLNEHLLSATSPSREDHPSPEESP